MEHDDVGAMRLAMMERLEQRLGRLLGGASEELTQFAAVTAGDLARAAAMGREDLVRALEEQLAARAEAMRLRGAREVWAEAGEILRDLAAAPIALARRLGS